MTRGHAYSRQPANHYALKSGEIVIIGVRLLDFHGVYVWKFYKYLIPIAIFDT